MPRSIRLGGRGACLLLLVVGACAGSSPQPPTTATARDERVEPAHVHGASTPQTGASESRKPYVPQAASQFDQRLKAHSDMTFDQLVATLERPRAKDRKLGFEPRDARYFERARSTLQMTDAELQLFDRRGFVAVDHQRDFSMGSAYFAIYTRDLPVLVTTDSVLYAFHRSFDNALSHLETGLLMPALEAVLDKTHTALQQSLSDIQNEPERLAYADVDLYLTVARNLVAGAGAELAPAGTRPAHGPFDVPDAWDGSLLVASATDQDSIARGLLERIAKLQLEQNAATELFGEARSVDYSQFRPRGHYTLTTLLKRYFRTMMWLGRADTGLRLEKARERRAAALLSRLIEGSGAQAQLAGVRRAIDYLVGVGSSVTPEALAGALSAVDDEASGRGPALPSDNVIGVALKHLAEGGVDGAQLIRSETVASDPSSLQPAALPALFQVFGQRFSIDSFALSKVVFDEIVFEGAKVPRMMPSSLDVAAVLGNDEALWLLEDELTTYPYAANLQAAREVVAAYEPADWSQTVYNRWLSTLRALDDVPERGAFPDLMRTRAWQRKQLQTQLSSWAQLRHDTVLYVKQSYTSFALCEYPEGYVEPYPEVFQGLAGMATRMAEVVREIPVAASGQNHQASSYLRANISRHFDGFAGVMAKLERLARKELASKPFTSSEARFLKQTIDVRGGGSGAPTYSGWYPMLVYGETPRTFHPSVTDVHTDPNASRVLQVGTGRAQFLVAAIDNAGDRAVYVGPIFSFYEFTQSASKRLTDEEWTERVSTGNTPEPPAWVSPFRTHGVTRSLQ